MTVNNAPGKKEWVNADAPPELTDAFFDRAELREGNKLIRRGRPPTCRAKEKVSVRFDQDVLAALRAGGAGWQSRINGILRKAVGLG
jgi:uncharacterized protein (DUF4415 family)